MQPPIYMDNHATTRVDPRVVDAMAPYWTEHYGNAGSVSHAFGHRAAEAADEARHRLAAAIGASPREIVFTSGATESNNLAIRGVLERARLHGNHVVSVATEHRAVLDPLARLARKNFEITLATVKQAGDSRAGELDLEQFLGLLRDDTALVSVMLANNEIGVVQPVAEIARECRRRGIAVHTDATQAVGKLPLDVSALGVDLMSFSAHKIYGPKGIGALYVRRGPGSVRLVPQVDGGGQEGGLRSGTLNVPGMVGFAAALDLCLAELPAETLRLAELRNRLQAGIVQELEGVRLNGPDLHSAGLRLPGNLNLSFTNVDGEALMMSMQRLAVSSGSACTSANPEPSHVLRALGLGEDHARASLRFGLGRFNTADDVEQAIGLVADAVRRLRRLATASQEKSAPRD